jgi:hypothetical protein
MKKKRIEVATCSCQHVAIELSGEPIVAASCYCASCQQAGQRFELDLGTGPVRDNDAGTRYVLYRKDRLRFTSGHDRLQEHRLTPSSFTRRLVATCCNTPMFLDMTKGHWLSIYADRLPTGIAPLEMRVMLKDLPAGATVATDVPSFQRHNGKFFWRLIAAWIRMGLRTPQVPA